MAIDQIQADLTREVEAIKTENERLREAHREVWMKLEQLVIRSGRATDIPLVKPSQSHLLATALGQAKVTLEKTRDLLNTTTGRGG